MDLSDLDREIQVVLEKEALQFLKVRENGFKTKLKFRSRQQNKRSHEGLENSHQNSLLFGGDESYASLAYERNRI